jgi:hypothetical protein
VNSCVNPTGIVVPLGVAWQDTSATPVTLILVLPEALPSVAVMVLLPAATEVARPIEPVALLMVATPVLEEDHVTVFVRFCVDPSE